MGDSPGIRHADAGRARVGMRGPFARGLFLDPMGTKLTVSLAHDGAACDAFVERFDDALAAA